MVGLLLAAFLAVNVQDADARTLLQSEDAWASALVKMADSPLDSPSAVCASTCARPSGEANSFFM